MKKLSMIMVSAMSGPTINLNRGDLYETDAREAISLFKNGMAKPASETREEFDATLAEHDARQSEPQSDAEGEDKQAAAEKRKK